MYFLASHISLYFILCCISLLQLKKPFVAARIVKVDITDTNCTHGNVTIKTNCLINECDTLKISSAANDPDKNITVPFIRCAFYVALPRDTITLLPNMIYSGDLNTNVRYSFYAGNESLPGRSNYSLGNYSTSGFHLKIIGGDINHNFDENFQGSSIIKCNHSNFKHNEIYNSWIFGNNSVIVISNVAFMNCNAFRGGALVLETSEVLLTNLAFYNNSAEYGGAVDAQSTKLTVSNSSFYYNKASNNGGAVNLEGSSGSFDNCRFLGNSAGLLQRTTNYLSIGESIGRGGAIFYDNQLTSAKDKKPANSFPLGINITDSVISNNFAGFRGGGLFATNATSYINRVLFQENHIRGISLCDSNRDCALRGGGAYLDKMSIEIVESRFNRNYIDVNSTGSVQISEGGGIYAKGFSDYRKTSNYISFSRSWITNNNCSNFGGGLYVSDMTVLLTHTHVNGNVVGQANTDSSDHLSSSSAGGGMFVQVTKALTKFFKTTIESDSEFVLNSAIGGVGGAIFLSYTSDVTVSDVYFLNNTAFSSYSSSAAGGAVMIRGDSSAIFTRCNFSYNIATPIFTLVPLTYSGEGGAVFVQSSKVSISLCYFKSNYAVSGQFDDGASGGAILLEAANPQSQIVSSTFIDNGASGFAVSTFAASGSGGAIVLKFTTLNISNCDFINNWATVGGSDNSLGGAIAIFYSPSNGNNNLTIAHCNFVNNSAIGESCNKSPGTGRGGAVAVVGFSLSKVIFYTCTFYGNIAFANQDTLAISMGGAIENTLSSKIAIVNSKFAYNEAIRGIGHDISSITANNPESTTTTTIYYYNQVEIVHSTFKVLSNVTQAINTKRVEDLSASTCITVTKLTTEKIPKCSACLSPNSVTRRLNKLNEQDEKFFTRRKLATISQLILSKPGLNVFRPSMVFTDTLATLKNTELEGIYELFVGDINAFISGANPTSSDENPFVSRLIFTGALNNGSDSFTVTLRAVNANVLTQTENILYFKKLDFINSTFVMGKDIVVANATLLYACFFNNFSAHQSTSVPTITFTGVIYTDVKFGSSDDFGYKVYVLGLPLKKQINFLNATDCNINIQGILVVSYNVEGQQMLVLLNGIAKFNILAGGVLKLTTPTNISMNSIGARTPSMTNSGAITLAGKPLKELLLATEIAIPQIKILTQTSSLYSPLYVNGNFESSGPDNSINILLSNYSQSTPVLYLTNDGGMSGANVNLDFFSQQPNICVESYLTKDFDYICSQPSKWTVVKFNQRLGSSSSDINYNAPSGITFSKVSIQNYPFPTPSSTMIPTFAPSKSFRPTHSPSVMPISPPSKPMTSVPTFMPSFEPTFTSVTVLPTVQPTPSSAYEEVLQVQSLSCDTIETYAYGLSTEVVTSLSAKSDGYFCNLCVNQQGCSYCATSGNANDGKCGTSSSQCAGSSSHLYTKTCCKGDCDGNGDCVYSDDEWKCNCNVWTKSSDCSRLSETSIALITISSLFTFICVTVLAVKKYNKHQLEIQLDELKEDLLNDDGDGMAGTANKYIRDMRQDLILKDVMVKFEDIKIEKKIGEGSFGVVYKASFRGAQVALKQMRSMFVQLTEHDINEFKKEAYMMSRLRHPNIVLVMGISLMEGEMPSKPISKSAIPIADSDMPEKEDNGGNEGGKAVPKKQICILTEYLEQGSLADILYGSTRLPAEIWSYELVLACALQTARGMLYLHSNSPPICHRDLKSSNLVVDDRWVVKVTDFGMSRIVPEDLQDKEKGIGLENDRGSISNLDTQNLKGEMEVRNSELSLNDRNDGTHTEMTSNLGTTAWCAPELLTASSKTRYSIKVDVYSFGMVLWELWERKRPWDELNSRFDIIDAIRAGRRPAISDSCPPAFRSLMQRCWQQEPARRPNFQYIVRYLKDEHARVKRTRSINPKLNSNTAQASFSYNDPTSPLDFDSNFVTEGGEPGSIPSLRESLTAKLFETFGGITKTSSNNNSRNNSNNNKVNKDGSNKSNSGASQSSNNSNSNDDNNNTTSRSSIGGTNTSKNNWRDKYVMKISGWNANEPDEGLPPSMGTAGGGGSNRANETHNPMVNNYTSNDGKSNSNSNVRDMSSRPNHAISVDLDETSTPFPLDDLDDKDRFRDSNNSVTSRASTTSSITEMRTLRDKSNPGMDNSNLSNK